MTDKVPISRQVTRAESRSVPLGRTRGVDVLKPAGGRQFQRKKPQRSVIPVTVKHPEKYLNGCPAKDAWIRAGRPA